MIKAIRKPSPNCHIMSGRSIRLIVIHATASQTLTSALNWLLDPENKASCHYLIDRDGTIYQLVDEKDIAYHAGVSVWKGEHGLNYCSIGIELVNKNDGKDHYPAPQIVSLTNVVDDLRERYKVSVDNIVRHADISGPDVRPQDPKTDPKGFDFDAWKKCL